MESRANEINCHLLLLAPPSTMDLAHSKTMESAVSEVYNIPDSKSTDLIQPPPRANEGQNGGGSSALENGQQKGELKKLILDPIPAAVPLTISNACFSYPQISRTTSNRIYVFRVFPFQAPSFEYTPADG